MRTLLTAAAVLAFAGAASAAEPMAPPDGWRLVFSDEFDTPGAPDPAKWTYDTARNKLGWYNDEKQYYAADRRKNARVEGGNLVIEAHAEKLDPKLFPDWGGQAYTSTRLLTRGKASWRYAYMEVRAKLPCGIGTWPAIWTLPENPGTWPQSGEIDIMEHVAYDPGVVHQTIHTGAFNHVKGTQKAAQTTVPTVCDQFHVYQLNWTSEGLVMGVDGRRRFRFDRSEKEAEWPFDRPHHLILNLAIGGWGGRDGIRDDQLPAKFEVDYVRVWQAP